MLIFNITFLVSDSANDKWMKWIQDEHIPFMLSTGDFSSPQLAKVISDNQQNGTSYALQYHIQSLDELTSWHQLHFIYFQKKCSGHFGEEVLFFTSILEILS